MSNLATDTLNYLDTQIITTELIENMLINLPEIMRSSPVSNMYHQDVGRVINEFTNVVNEIPFLKTFLLTLDENNYQKKTTYRAFGRRNGDLSAQIRQVSYVWKDVCRKVLFNQNFEVNDAYIQMKLHRIKSLIAFSNNNVNIKYYTEKMPEFNHFFGTEFADVQAVLSGMQNEGEWSGKDLRSLITNLDKLDKPLHADIRSFVSFVVENIRLKDIAQVKNHRSIVSLFCTLNVAIEQASESFSEEG